MSNIPTYKKKYLLIDGNYFAHRVIHGVRIAKPEFTLDSKQDQYNFETMLNNSLITLYKSFNNDFHRLIDNLIFVFDHKSWRKSVYYADNTDTSKQNTLFRPYYIDENSTESLGYKDNRKDLKDSNDINWDAFDSCLNNFKNSINKTLATLNFEGAEGDDNLFLLTEELKKKNILSIIFCTDGDLNTLVDDYTIILKNTKSNKSPNGEFVISENIYNQLFKEKSVLEKMLGNNFENDYFEKLFKIDVANAGSVRSNIERLKDTNIYTPNKYKDLLVKVICGDKKDNIFPIIRWEKSGRNYKVTEKMLEKAFNSVDEMEFTNDNVKKCFDDNKLMSQIILTLIKICDVTDVSPKLIGNHFKHNLRLNSLSYEHIPVDVQSRFSTNYNIIQNLIYRDISDIDIIGMNLKTIQNDSAKSLIVDSIPDEQKTQNNSTSSLIDDILNGK